MLNMKKWAVVAPWLAILVLFILAVWIPVVTAYQSYCFHNYDLGLFAQAITLLSPSTPNPWLSSSELFLFNDHFDPILFLLAPLKDLGTPALTLIHAEMLIILAAVIPFFLLARSGELSRGEALFASAFLLFNPLTLSALYYPVHPGTWALLPLSWTCYFLIRGSTGFALLSFFFVLLCKEEFPAIGLAIAAGLWMVKRRKAALWFAALSIAWALIAFGLRPLLIGPGKAYTDSLLTGSGLFSPGSEGSLTSVLKRMLTLILPLLPFILSRRKEFKWKENLSLVFASAFLALFAIRLVGGWWGNHRSAPLVVPLIFALIPLLHRTPSWTIRRWVLASVLLLGVAIAPMQKPLGSYAGKPFKKHCPVDSGRIASLDEATQMLLSLPEGPALVEGHLLPPVAERKLVSQLGANKIKEGEARYLLVEKPPYGDDWPSNLGNVQATIDRWRNLDGVKVLKEDSFVVLMEQALSANP